MMFFLCFGALHLIFILKFRLYCWKLVDPVLQVKPCKTFFEKPDNCQGQGMPLSDSDNLNAHPTF